MVIEGRRLRARVWKRNQQLCCEHIYRAKMYVRYKREFRRKIQAGDINEGVFNLLAVFATLNLTELTGECRQRTPRDSKVTT